MSTNFAWGNGTWFTIHLMARWANTKETVAYFNLWIKYLAGKLPCAECSKHAQEYIAANPPEEEDPFVWAWKFHNAVNRRLSKPELEYNTVRDLYFDDKYQQACTQCKGGSPPSNEPNRFIPSKY